MKLWKNLTQRGKIFVVGILFVTITFYLLFPIGRLGWYIATTDVPPHKSHVFKECSDINEALSFGDNSFTIDKDNWFCHNDNVPEKTQIYWGGKVIEPVTETSDSVTYAIDFLSLTGDWRLVAQNSE